jgi:hypothetical protein
MQMSNGISISRRQLSIREQQAEVEQARHLFHKQFDRHQEDAKLKLEKEFYDDMNDEMRSFNHNTGQSLPTGTDKTSPSHSQRAPTNPTAVKTQQLRQELAKLRLSAAKGEETLHKQRVQLKVQQDRLATAAKQIAGDTEPNGVSNSRKHQKVEFDIGEEGCTPRQVLEFDRTAPPSTLASSLLSLSSDKLKPKAGVNMKTPSTAKWTSAQINEKNRPRRSRAASLKKQNGGRRDDSSDSEDNCSNSDSDSGSSDGDGSNTDQACSGNSRVAVDVAGSREPTAARRLAGGRPWASDNTIATVPGQGQVQLSGPRANKAPGAASAAVVPALDGTTTPPRKKQQHVLVAPEYISDAYVDFKEQAR